MAGGALQCCGRRGFAGGDASGGQSVGDAKGRACDAQYAAAHVSDLGDVAVELGILLGGQVTQVGDRLRCALGSDHEPAAIG